MIRTAALRSGIGNALWPNWFLLGGWGLKRVSSYWRRASAPQASALRASGAIDDQRAACEALVEAMGGELVSVHEDLASGLSVDRPGLQAIFAEVDAGRLDVVVAQDAARIGRSSVVLSFVAARLHAAGVELRVASGPDIDLAASLAGPRGAAYARAQLEQRDGLARSGSRISGGLRNVIGVSEVSFRHRVSPTTLLASMSALRRTVLTTRYQQATVTVEAIDRHGVVHTWRTPEGA